MPTIDEFETTAHGGAFYRAYDDMLARWPASTVTSDLESEFGRTRITTFGAGGPPVILLGGGGATSMVWFDLAGALGASSIVHAVDVMGDVGRSVPRGRPILAPEDLLDWLDTVVEGIGTQPLSIVGHSYGAMIALAYALRAGDRVDRLVLLDPNSCFASMSPRYLVRALPILLRPTEKRQRSFLQWETEGAAIDDGWLDMSALGAAHFPTNRTVVPKRPTAAALARLSALTTVILAGRSKVHDRAGVAAAVTRLLPNARVETIDSATHHALPLLPRDEVTAALIAALT